MIGYLEQANDDDDDDDCDGISWCVGIVLAD